MIDGPLEVLDELRRAHANSYHGLANLVDLRAENIADQLAGVFDFGDR
jgi:hypothetical protein